MLLMTLLQLKYIVKIVECGSMNEASHELYVSQPALSSSVKELENELGIEIFTRSSQGIALTVDGAEFLTYARQVLDQADLLEERYKNAKPRKQLCSVSTQHYMFAVEAFVEMIDSIKSDEYEFTIRETRTKDIINQVANMLSEIGIIYLSDFNKDVIGKMLREKHLEFHPLFRAPLHVFISRNNPLAGKKKVTMDDLKQLELNVPDYEFVSAVSYSSGKVTNGTKSLDTAQLVGCDENYFTAVGSKLTSGRLLTADECTGGAMSVVIDQQVVNKLWGSSDTEVVGQSIRINNDSYTIVGVIEASSLNGQMIYLPSTTLATRVSGVASIDQIVGYAREDADMSTIADKTKNFLVKYYGISKENQDYSVSVTTMKSIVDELDTTMALCGERRVTDLSRGNLMVPNGFFDTYS